MQETQKMIFRMKRRPVEEPIELLCKFTNLEIKTDNEYKPSRVQEDPFGFLQNQLKKFEITDTQRKSLYLKRIDVSKFKTICNDYIGDQKKQLLNEKKILSRNEIINANRFKTDHKSENKDQNIQNSILQSVMKQKQQIQKQLNINEDQIMQDEQQIENQDEKLSRNMKKFQYFKDLEAQEERIKNANIVLYNLNSHHEQLFCNNQPLEAESLINQVDYDYYILTSEQVQDQKLVQTVYFDKKFKLKPFEEEEMGDFIDEYPEQYKSESSKSYDPNDAEDRDSNHEDFADNDYPDEESSKGSKNSDEELDFKNNFMKRMNQKQQNQQNMRQKNYRDEFDSFE